MKDILMYSRELLLCCLHGPPMPLKRHRTGKSFSGKMIHFDPSKKDKANLRQHIQLLINQYYPNFEMFDEPIQVYIQFYFARPKKHFGTGRNAGKLLDSAPIHYAIKPDIDNLEKFYLDTFNNFLFRDDAQVVRVTKQKNWADGVHRLPSVEFAISPKKPEDKDQNKPLGLRLL